MSQVRLSWLTACGFTYYFCPVNDSFSLGSLRTVIHCVNQIEDSATLTGEGGREVPSLEDTTQSPPPPRSDSIRLWRDKKVRANLKRPLFTERDQLKNFRKAFLPSFSVRSFHSTALVLLNLNWLQNFQRKYKHHLQVQ